jgi:hypothetical protein
MSQGSPLGFGDDGFKAVVIAIGNDKVMGVILRINIQSVSENCTSMTGTELINCRNSSRVDIDIANNCACGGQEQISKKSADNGGFYFYPIGLPSQCRSLFRQLEATVFVWFHGW